MSGHDGSGVKSAERALTILELFSRRNRALTFTEVADLLGYPRSSLHGLLRTLADRGWLRLDPATRRFSLGIRAWEAGSSFAPAVELVRSAAPVVEQLRDVVDGTVHVSVLDGAETVRVLGSDAGEVARAAAHASGAGRVLLANLDGLPDAPGAPADAEELQRRLDRVRVEGWADGDSSDGVPSLAVPVRGGDGAVVAALGVAAPGLGAGERDGVLRALQQGAERISAALGYQPAG